MADIPNKPITRKEAYLAAIGGQNVDVPAKPITREEAYLAAILNNGLGAKNLEDLDDVLIVDPVNGYVIKFDADLGKWVAGPASGSGGTSDYTDLSNKPQINGNTLAGNKSAEDLGLAGSDDIPTKVSDLDNDANFISDDNYVHTDNNYDDTAKGIVEGVTEALAGKQDTLTFDNIPTENSNNPVKSGGVYTALENYVDIQANCGFHNSIYHGKNLGTSVTAAQWASISAGTFEDMYVGDYWVINGVTWRIAHFDYWLNTGDTNCTTHHVVIVPDTNLYSAQMNTENVTTGGYYSSKMRGGENYLVSGSSNLYNAKVAIDNAFGSAHILSHRELLTNGVSDDNASGWAWYDSTVDLMSEVMVYGTFAWSVGGKGYEVGIDKEQLALFRLDHSRICNRANWWLRSVYSATLFAIVADTGYAAYAGASLSRGVRPAFAIK